MSLQNAINLVRNVHFELFNDPDTQPIALPLNSVLLETGGTIEPPYLIIRRGDEIYPPFSARQPIAHLLDLEYVISEDADGLGQIELAQDTVKQVRDLDALFMAKITDHPSFRRTGDVDEGLSDERPAYLLTRTVEIAADAHIPLAEGIPEIGAMRG